MRITHLVLFISLALHTAWSSAEENGCSLLLDVPLNELHYYQKNLPFSMKGFKVASVQDATNSTGATLFYFPKGAYASYDARGGSVASAETHLLDEGSYSNNIDGIVFAGGSTMGLAAADGVREIIFNHRAQRASDFDFIPSIPAAVVYDFDGRISEGNDTLVYPNAELGKSLMQNLKSQFTIGRAGVGVNTSVNKINLRNAPTIWGGQGAAYAEYPWGKVFVAVALNALGDVQEAGQSLSQQAMQAYQAMQKGVKPKHNTTLSIVVTDVPLTRNQLRRLSVQLHTSMAESIFPFHSYHDGDINYAVSLEEPTQAIDETVELNLGFAASLLMKKAIIQSVKTSNLIQ